MAGQVWEVVGGKKDGLLVRTGKALKSPEAAGRLSSGSLVEEVALDGERLHYRLLTGGGPQSGWVSLKLKGSDLLVRTGRRPTQEPLAPANGSGGYPPVPAVPAPPAAALDLPQLPRGSWRALLPSRAGAAGPTASLHVCLCTICETGHMLPTMRIARALVARSAVRKVTVLTNVYGARRIADWLTKEPDSTGKIEVLEFEDGWDQELMDRANAHAQLEDGSYHNQCNDGIAECAVSCLEHLAFGDDRPSCFVVDVASGGFDSALQKARVPQTVIKSTPLSSLAYPMVMMGGADSAPPPSDGTHGSTPAQMTIEDFDKELERVKATDLNFEYPTDLVHCFALPPMLAAYLPKMPKHAIPVGILVDEVKSGQLPEDVRDFVERPGPPILYISMGSVASFSREQMAKVVDALKAPGEWRVLWSLRKAQQDLLPAGGTAALGSDFFVSAWLPQAELLQHPKIAAFMSHCGWGACCEAIASGKPVVAFPMFADQYANAWLLDIFGMGKTVDEEALTMDPSSGKRRMMRVVGIRNGTTEHTRDRFTAEGLRGDIRAVLKNRGFGAKAAAMKEYSRQNGGARKAAEELERLAAEAAAKLAARGAAPAWPAEPLPRLRAVAEARAAEVIAAAKADMVLQIVISDVGTDGKFYLQTSGQDVVVHEGEAASPSCTIKVKTEAALHSMWHGRFDAAQFEVVGDRTFARRLFTLLFLEHQHAEEVDRRTPLDGVVRPPKGGRAPEPQMKSTLSAPAWLKPDGVPEKKNKVLFLSLPWAGHIVHLRRIAAWFAEHPKYEVHFAYLSETPPDVPNGVKLHGAEAGELTSIFNTMQENLKKMGMSEIGEANIASDVDLDAEGHKVLKFMLRVFLKIKPTVLVADSGFSLGGMLRAISQAFRSNVLFVNSPGIKEKWIAEMEAKEEPHADKVENLKQSSGMPDIDIGKVMNGTFDTTTLPDGIQEVLKIPGMDLMRLLQVFGALAAPDPSKAPMHFYPSAGWMVEDQAEAGELFTCPLLPLPAAPRGEVQVGREALAACLEADLLEWMFASPDPIVYVAFGTIVKGAQPIVEKLARALDGCKWRVLWSLPQDMQSWLPGGLSKERWCVRKFVPQKDVFRCDRVRCFISHCGANSTIEAMSCGVPMVCHPFFLDQYEWARTVRRHLRAGVQVDKFDSDDAAIRLAVTEVIEDPSYLEAARAVSKRLRVQAEMLKAALGPQMSSTENLGPGAAVIAAVILSVMKGKDPSDIIELVQQTNR